MIADADLERIAERIPVLHRADAAEVRAFRESGFLVRMPAGRDVFVEGQEIGAVPILISGTVRVYQIGESGREVTLYRFRPGESCVLTANAVLTHQSFPAIATTEEEAEAVMIPAEIFRTWVARTDLWRGFFVDTVAQRLASVMSVVDEVAFRRLDRRVAALLWRRAAQENPVLITHQEIAAELGSAREAVSRVLEDLSSRGLVVVARGRVEVVDGPALESLAAR